MRNIHQLTAKKILFLALFPVLAGVTPLFAINFNFTPPILDGNNPYIEEINSRLGDIFSDMERELKDSLGGIDTNPEKMIKAFATSSVFASTGATQRNYSGYDLFAITVGPMVGIQLPVSPLSVFSELDNILDNMETKGDIELGVNPQVLSAQIGVNFGFLFKGLYLGLKGGYMSLDFNELGLTFDTRSIGFMANYQLFAQKKVLGGLFLWRGLNLGSGFIYQSTKLGIALPLETTYESISIYEPETGSEIRIGTEIKPELTLNFNTTTYTVPLEVITSIRLLGFLNFSLGAGVDLGFGNADLNAGGKADINFTDRNIYVKQPANMSVTMGGKHSPGIFNPKVMAGFGLNFGPIVIDVPVTYYFNNNGYSAGLSLGLVL